MVKRLSLKSPSDHLLLRAFLILLSGVVDSATAQSTPEPTTTLPTTTLPTTTLPPSTTKPLPGDVQKVTVVTQNETSITLKWDQVDNITTYILEYDNGAQSNDVNASSGQPVKHVVANLTAGTRYSFTLFTVDGGDRSEGHNFTAVTAPRNVQNVTVLNQTETNITLRWERVDKILNYTLRYSENETNWSEDVTGSTGNPAVEHVVSDLTAGKRYFFTLLTWFEEVPSSGFAFNATTAPLNTAGVQTTGQTETSISLQWEKVAGVQGYALTFNGTEIKFSASEVNHTVPDLISGTKYSFTHFSVFEGIRSRGKEHVAATAPEDVKNVTVVTQNETSVTLRWDKAKTSFTYILQQDDRHSCTQEERNMSVTCTVSPLDAGRRYNFTLFTVFEYINSTGLTFEAVTVPPQVSSITVRERSKSAIKLVWDNNGSEWRYLVAIDGGIWPVPPGGSSKYVSVQISPLQPGTVYPFSVTTEYLGLRSRQFDGVTLTLIACREVDWKVNATSIQGTVEGAFTSSSATDYTHTVDGGGDKTVSFTGLHPGATYYIRFYYDEIPDPLLQCSLSITILPSDHTGRCEYEASGHSVRVVWDKPFGIWTSVELNVSGRQDPVRVSNGQLSVVIPGFQPARTYQVSLGLLSRDMRSQTPFVFDCATDPRGVIAGSLVGVLLFLLLVSVAAFIILKRPDIISKKSFFGRSKQPIRKNAPISEAKFPDHFAVLSMDENRGFSLEYENLSPVGTDQTRKVASLPENKVKNRFTNVLPYDWNRVKLSTSNPSESSDYINASYMPGYNGNREFIATQGPLPVTVNDFWRMVWEQRVRGIVMVTNCSEGGRTKCEQYWPEVSQHHQFGQLSVTTCSEQRESNWTLREFRLKHKNESEERPVRHFHFTAWPDHGVPQGTEVLIQFRALVRQHIDSEGTKAPTLVHCSAGVGRTGTIIALDTLLQQLERERAVGINAFVHKMRLNRPYMVQTESQYVFLHQCIMDSLRSNAKMDEHIYENTDMIYANATALQELHRAP